MNKIIATCGHDVSEGIACSIKEDEGLFSYGVYCTDCTMEIYLEGKLDNPELRRLMLKAQMLGDSKE